MRTHTTTLLTGTGLARCQLERQPGSSPAGQGWASEAAAVAHIRGQPPVPLLLVLTQLRLLEEGLLVQVLRWVGGGGGGGRAGLCRAWGPAGAAARQPCRLGLNPALQGSRGMEGSASEPAPSPSVGRVC